MSENSALLAHLVPKLTSRVEDTATDALAFILNRSDPARKALDQLLSDVGFDLPPIILFETQATYEDGSRPDMIGTEELAPSFPRRMRGLNQLIDDVIDARATKEGWATTRAANGKLYMTRSPEWWAKLAKQLEGLTEY